MVSQVTRGSLDVSDDPFSLTQAEVDELNEADVTEEDEYSDDPGAESDIVIFVICNILEGYDGQRPDHEYEYAELQFEPDDPEPEVGEYHSEDSEDYEEDDMDDEELLSQFD